MPTSNSLIYWSSISTNLWCNWLAWILFCIHHGCSCTNVSYGGPTGRPSDPYKHSRMSTVCLFCCNNKELINILLRSAFYTYAHTAIICSHPLFLHTILEKLRFLLSDLGHTTMTFTLLVVNWHQSWLRAGVKLFVWEQGHSSSPDSQKHDKNLSCCPVKGLDLHLTCY